MESNLLIQMYRITWLFFLSLKSLKNTLLQFDEMVKILWKWRICLEDRQAYVQLKIFKHSRGFYGGGGGGTRRSFMPVRVDTVLMS